MQFTANGIRLALGMAVLVLALGLGSAYIGAKMALQYAKHSPTHSMNFYRVDDPPKPCQGC